ncbi:MAG: hypothetical protein HOM11_11020 [Methylococcales bacterium]|jgi:hypothetical protein|nr:hypothetical protein [Methylococcales bacterium]
MKNIQANVLFMIFLFGFISPALADKIGYQFKSNWGVIDFVYDENTDAILGTYGPKKHKLEGHLQGQILHGNWQHSNSKKHGALVMTFDKDFSSFKGKWNYSNDAKWRKNWNGTFIKLDRLKTTMKKNDAPSEGVLVSLSAGDVACYVELKLASANITTQMAEFEICDQESLINQPVKLTYTQANVMAANCDGNPECTRTEKKSIINKMEPTQVQSVQLSEALCKSNEVRYAGCKTKKGKTISLCTENSFADNYDDTPAYLFYRYGKQNKVELEYPAKKVNSGAQFKTIMARYAGANTRFLAYFKNGNVEYLYEDAYLGAERIHGIGVFKNNKRLTFVKCDNHSATKNQPSDIKDNDLFWD